MTVSENPDGVRHQVLKSESGDGVKLGRHVYLKASRRPSRVNLLQLARGVADTVLAITFAYELGFERFKKENDRDKKIYNLVKKSLFLTASRVTG